jgi:hypothetical protein
VSRLRRRTHTIGLTLGILATTATIGLSAGPAAAAAGQTCAGTFESPGVLSGKHAANVTVEGFCAVNAGAALINGNLTVRPGAILVAAFGLNDQAGSGNSSLTVRGNLQVQPGATMLLGCDPQSFPCLDDPNSEAPSLASQTHIYGNLTEQQPLGVVMHNDIVDGNIGQSGGGGGVTCEPSGIFAAFGSPVYSDYEDSTIRGNLSITGVTSCWMGVIRLHASGNVSLVNNKLADPDAIEILSNKISGNLACQQNSNVWNSSDTSENLYPRAPEPNTVLGTRSGQCVHASPATEGGPLGPGPF